MFKVREEVAETDAASRHDINFADNDKKIEYQEDEMEHQPREDLPRFVSRADVIETDETEDNALSNHQQDASATVSSVSFESHNARVPAESEGIEMQSMDNRAIDNAVADIPTSTVAINPRSNVSSEGDRDESDDFHTTTAPTNEDIVDQLDFEDRKVQYQRNKWMRFGRLQCCRLLVLALSVLLLLLSLSFCGAQLLTVELDLVTRCPEPKTQEEIWQHSLEAGTVNGEVVINEESQYGWSQEACWTTHEIEVNTDLLWYRNRYIVRRQTINLYSVLFGILSILSSAVIVHLIRSMWIDFNDLRTDRLHKRSKMYINHLQHFKAIHNGRAPPGPNATSHQQNSEPVHVRYGHRLCRLYQLCGGWILAIFLSEFIEIALQSQALLLYGGSNLLDPEHSNDIYLSNKPEMVLLFASFLSLNCILSSLLWIFFLFVPKRCGDHLGFKIVIICCDQITDLLYTVYPLIVILSDSYNENTDDLKVILGQLNFDSLLPFLAAAVPLLFLCTKSLFLARESREALREHHYNQWLKIKNLTTNPNDAMTISAAKQHGVVIDQKTLDQNGGELFDSNGNLVVDLTTKSIGSQNVTRFVKLALSIMCTVYISFGVALMFYVENHLTESANHCGSISEHRYFANGSFHSEPSSVDQLHLTMNPELFLWEYCQYRVYPFSSNPCQCRVLVLDWENLLSSSSERQQYFNLTEQALFDGVLNNWFMMEKFKSSGADTDSTQIIAQHLRRSLSKMKALEINDIIIISNEDGIWNLESLEYMSFADTLSMSQLPIRLHDAENLKYISLKTSGIEELSNGICNLRNLSILHIATEVKMASLPHCIGDMDTLQAVWVENNWLLSDIPVSLLSLPNVIELSLYGNNIDWDSLLHYNFENDSAAAAQWFDFNFRWNQQGTFWMDENPICDDDEDDELVIENRVLFEDDTDDGSIPLNLQLFLNNSCVSEKYCWIRFENTQSTQSCVPRRLGDGRCDIECLDEHCYFDYLDCVQLCVAGNVTACSKQEYLTAKCQICDTDSQYLQSTLSWHEDNHEMIIENGTDEYAPCEPSCWSEYCSIYSPQQIALDVLPEYESLDAVGRTDEYCDHGYTPMYQVSYCGFDSSSSNESNMYLDPNIADWKNLTCVHGYIDDGKC